MDISVSCSTHGCRNSIGASDDAYCESCMSSVQSELDDSKTKIKELETQIEGNEEEISNLETELAEAREATVQLRDIIKGCGTCAAILVAKNL